MAVLQPAMVQRAWEGLVAMSHSTLQVLTLPMYVGRRG